VSETRIEQVKSMIRQAFTPYRSALHGHRVMFFGSRVAGTARERSDFDVAIDGAGPVDVRLLGNIRDRLDDLPTLYRIDLVDLATLAPRTRDEMLRHTERFL
jgi:predicted nucleotidyltransferase